MPEQPASARAVFLSYASQDKEVARRICDALRATGLEVWFDVSELRGGDAWDQKIRKQIKECALFVPLITPTTNARPEGYFRLEWKLAVDRSHLLADDHPFLFPIAVGDVDDASARVPDKFREVQWTRLRLDETPGEIAGRVAKLLRSGAANDAADGRDRRAEKKPELSSLWTPRKIWKYVILIMVAYYALRPIIRDIIRDFRGEPAQPAVTPPAQSKAAGPAVDAVRDWPKDPELKKVSALLNRIDMIPEDLRLAEEICQRALDRASTDPEAVTLAASVQSMWLQRGWDRTSERYLKTQRLAERALQLAPDEPEAMLAMAMYIYQRPGGGYERAYQLIARAMELRPDDARYVRMQLNLLSLDPAVGGEKAVAAAEAAAAQFPRDALVRYELGRIYRNLGRWAEFERANDEALALAPIANALVWKARGQGLLHGDLAGMKATLDRVPDRVRSIERTVYAYFIYAVLTGNYAVGADALSSMADPWMIDFDYHGPRALPLASLLELQGKPALARIQYEAALQELKRHQSDAPDDLLLKLNEAWTLHGLGRNDEARVALAAYLESLARPLRLAPMNSWWLQAIPACLLIGERGTGLALMREVAEDDAGRAMLRNRLAADPRMTPFRADPEIQAILERR